MYTSKIFASRGRVNSQKLAADFLTDKPEDAKAWVESRVGVLLGDKTAQVFADLYSEAGWLGFATGVAHLHDVAVKGAISNVVDWGTWTPGNPEAAAKLLNTKRTPGLRGLVEKRFVTIKGMNDTQYKRLGNILKAGLTRGDNTSTIASNISAYMNRDRSWAETVARTETRSAVTEASLDSYRDAQIEMVEWLTADGGCETCGEYEDMGPVPLDEGFGDVDGPPAHPNCLCVILPVISDTLSNDVTDSVDMIEMGVEADLTKASRDAVGRALAALKLIPKVDKKHIRAPWLVTERPALDPEMWAGSNIRAVHIQDLYASQHLLRKKTVKKYIKTVGNVDPDERSLGNVYDTNNRLVIVDGHHRLAALWLLGADFANVWFLEE